MAVLAAVAVFAGFAPSYFLKTVYGTPALSPLLHIHGALFTTWILLLVTQTALVAARRTDLHRRLGIGGAALAAVMTVLALMVSIDGGRRGAAASGEAALGFLAIPLGTVVVFPALVGVALALRRKTDAHKRLMLIATIELVTAGVGRLGFLAAYGPLGFFIASDLFIVALWIYDYATRGRIHAASLWGGLFLIASQVLRVAVSGTETWLSFARWITG
jgi:ethanolamine utilization microcompartment shell protein EutS